MVGEERKINWVDCNTVCRSVDEEGFGIKNLRAFNLVLLGKWKWKLKRKETGYSSKLLLIDTDIGKVI